MPDNFEEVVEVDEADKTFATVMQKLTVIGVIMMLIPGIIYLAKVDQYVHISKEIKYWNLPANKFWEKVKGKKIYGYSWFLKDLEYTDTLSLLGVTILLITPLVSIIAAIPKADKIYKILLAILVLEFIITIIKPLL